MKTKMTKSNDNILGVTIGMNAMMNIITANPSVSAEDISGIYKKIHRILNKLKESN